MDATTTEDVTWLRPASFAEECALLLAQLDADFEPLHRLGEELLARLAPTATLSARGAY
jgi:hypothetical protein